MTNRSLAALRAVRVGGFVALSCSVVTCGGSSSEAPSAEATRARGQQLYADTCALCHGANGEGYRADEAPKLAGQEFLSHASDDFLRAAIARGRPSTTMSAWSTDRGGPLSDDDVNAIVAFLRSLQTVPSVALDPQPITGDVTRGAAVYETECRSCHGEKGTDGKYVQIANPEFLASANDAYLRAAIQHGRPDTPMPAFESRLAPADIDGLVALIRSWQRPVDGPETLPPGPGGLTDVVINPGGPEPGFDPNAEFIPVDTVKAALDTGASFVMADARPPSDYAASHIDGAISVPFYQVTAFIPQIPKDKFIITYCGCPHAESGQAASVFRANGYARVAVLDEGFNVWRTRGYPVRSGGAP